MTGEEEEESLLAGMLHLGIIKVKCPKKGPALLTRVTGGDFFPLAVCGGAQGAAPLWKAKQPFEQGGVMEGGTSGCWRSAWA